MFKTLSEISRDIAQVFFASMFVGPIVTGMIKQDFIVLGLLLSVTFWIISLTLLLIREKL